MFDEWQVTYPSTAKEVSEAYPISDTKRAEEVAQSHTELQGLFKKSSQSKCKWICFAAYGVEKRDSFLATPWAFGKKISDLAYFEKDEMKELYDDFQNRTQLPWIREKGVPESFKFNLEKRTNHHVGYVACVLGTVNSNTINCGSEEQLDGFFYSTDLLQTLCSQRASPGWFDLLSQKPDPVNPDTRSTRSKDKPKASTSQVEVFKQFLKGGFKAPLAENCLYETFVRKGWLVLINDDQDVSIPCPLSREILYHQLYSGNRKDKDDFKNPSDFMMAVLNRISSTELEIQLGSKKRNFGSFLERMFIFFFFHVLIFLASNLFYWVQLISSRYTYPC